MKKRIFFDNKKFDYFIYDDGRVYSEKTKKFLSPVQSRPGNDYQKVALYYDNKPYRIFIHRLVANAFIPNPYNKSQVNHIDGDKRNNHVSNLEWVTVSENILHAFKNNLKTSKKGSASHLCIYDDGTIRQICELLSEGIMTLKEISKITNVSFTMIYLIATKQCRTDISNSYDVTNYYRDRLSYTHEQFEEAFKLLEDNKLSLYDISDITGLKYSSLNNIIRKQPNPKYNDLFMQYDISVYTTSDKKYSKCISNSLKNDIIKYIDRDIKPKYIKRILSKQYGINEECIRVLMRKMNSSTTIEKDTNN